MSKTGGIPWGRGTAEFHSSEKGHPIESWSLEKERIEEGGEPQVSVPQQYFG
jgi:hypothetical protein